MVMPDKNPPRAVTVTLSPQLLEKVLGLPPGVRITGAMHDSITQVIILRLDGPDFPVVIEGAIPVRATLAPNPKTKKYSISQ